jgi:hypothetical protein
MQRKRTDRGEFITDGHLVPPVLQNGIEQGDVGITRGKTHRSVGEDLGEDS